MLKTFFDELIACAITNNKSWLKKSMLVKIEKNQLLLSAYQSSCPQVNTYNTGVI